MSESAHKTTKVLTIVSGCLIAVAAVQAYFLFHMHQEMAGNIASAATGSPSGGENEKKGEGDESDVLKKLPVRSANSVMGVRSEAS